MAPEGLFRANGDREKISCIKQHLEKNDYSILSKKYLRQPHELANLFKEIVRTIEPPIIPYDQFNDWINTKPNNLPQEEL